MSEAERERIKLTASLLNTLAANTIVVGVLGPAAGLLYGINAIQPDLRLLAIVVVALVLAAMFHQVGRFILGGLDA